MTQKEITIKEIMEEFTSQHESSLVMNNCRLDSMDDDSDENDDGDNDDVRGFLMHMTHPVYRVIQSDIAQV